jgi:cytochrome c553
MKNNQNRKSNTPNFDARLLAETGNHCPLCGEPLLGKKSGKSMKLYQIAHIYPYSPTKEQLEELQDVPMAEDRESFENKIALCLNCHKKQDVHTQKEEYIRLYNKKQQLMRQTKAMDGASTVFIEDEIKEVLQKLKEADIKKLIPLSYDAISVDKKITQENGLLLNDVRDKVVQYFLFVQEILQDIDKSGPQKSKIIASEIKTCFLKAADRGLSQEEIFSTLVDWLTSKTQSQSELACRIIISYFVQDCEVFDAFA